MKLRKIELIFLDVVENPITGATLSSKIAKLKKELDELVVRKDKVLDLRLSAVIPQEECKEKYKKVSSEIEIKTNELTILKNLTELQSKVKEGILKLKEIINANEEVASFDRDMFEALTKR